MALTEQEKALEAVRRLAKSMKCRRFFAEGRKYRRVGFRCDGQWLTGVGDTWKEALVELDRKTKELAR